MSWNACGETRNVRYQQNQHRIHRTDETGKVFSSAIAPVQVKFFDLLSVMRPDIVDRKFLYESGIDTFLIE